jgi:hypothetical protein
VAELQKLLTPRTFARAEALWDTLIRSQSAREVKALATTRLGRQAEAAHQLREWSGRLGQAARDLQGTPAAAIVAAERKRIASQATAASRSR